jgi:hypothetical protein
MFNNEAGQNFHPPVCKCVDCTRKRLEKLGISTENLKWDGKQYLKRCENGHWFSFDLGFCPDCAIGNVNKNINPPQLSTDEKQAALESTKPNEKIAQLENTAAVKPDSPSNPGPISAKSENIVLMLPVPAPDPEKATVSPAAVNPGQVENKPKTGLSSSIVKSNAVSPKRPLNTDSKTNIKPVYPKTARRNVTTVLLSAFGIIAVLAVFLLIRAISSTPEVAAPAPVVPEVTINSPLPAPTPSIQPEYLTFYNDLSGYTIDYPSAWKVLNVNGMHCVFADTGNSNTEIDVTREVRNYQTLINDLSSTQSGEVLKTKNGKNGLITYSLFTQTIGTRIRYEYVSDFSPVLLRIYCDYQSSSEVEKYFDKINSQIMHMILSYHPDSARQSPTTR